MSRMRRCDCNGPGNKITEIIMNSASVVHFAYLTSYCVRRRRTHTIILSCLCVAPRRSQNEIGISL